MSSEPDRKQDHPQSPLRRREHLREAVAPQALLDGILPLINLQARQLMVQVQTEVASDGSCVLCDSTMVEQVLLNLAHNAHAGHGPAASVGAGVADTGLPGQRRRAKKWIEFSVADVGVGIAPEVQQQLFDPFFTTRVDGMGLGLSLCRTVVEQHGGALVFKPNLPHGTVFIFTLPASAVA